MTIAATTLEGTSTTLTDADIDNLRRSVRGELVVAGEARYDEARRVWNGNVDRRPALIVRCLGAADVQQAVNFARSLASSTSSSAMSDAVGSCRTSPMAPSGQGSLTMHSAGLNPTTRISPGSS